MDKDFHSWLKASKERLASTQKRATELQMTMEDERIDLIILPWGGELAVSGIRQFRLAFTTEGEEEIYALHNGKIDQE